jgi:hypothetical protein
MSAAEDRFDRMEREAEERQRAAESLASVLGIGEATGAPEEGSEPSEEKPRDGLGRFVVGTADAGERGAPVVPKPSMGHLIMAHIDDDPSYLQ